MKKAIIILLACISMQSVAQQSPTAFKHANTIILSPAIDLIQVVSSLQNNGFTIDEYNAEIKTITTKAFKMWKSSNHTGTIHITQTDDGILITGFAFVQSFGSVAEGKMEKRGTGNMFGKCFEMVNEYAIQLASEHSLEVWYTEL